MAKTKKPKNGDLTKEQEVELQNKVEQQEKDIDLALQLWDSAYQQLCELEANVGSLNAEEEAKLKQDKLDAENKMIEAIQYAESCSQASKENKKKFLELKAKYEADLYNLEKKYKFDDESDKLRIQDLIRMVANREAELKGERTTAKIKIASLEKELKDLKTPNFEGKVSGAVNALHNIDLRYNDFYDEVAYLVIVYNELMHSKSDYDVKDYKKICKKAVKTLNKKIRKTNVRIIRQFD